MCHLILVALVFHLMDVQSTIIWNLGFEFMDLQQMVMFSDMNIAIALVDLYAKS
jgi:hypothetical protein